MIMIVSYIMILSYFLWIFFLKENIINIFILQKVNNQIIYFIIKIPNKD